MKSIIKKILKSPPHAKIKQEKFDFIVPSFDAFLMYVYGFFAFVLYFSPGFWDFIFMYAVDFISLIIVQYLGISLLNKSYPHTKTFFPYFNFDEINKLSFKDKKNFIQELVQFPKIRAMNILTLSFLKVIPACLIIVFLWPSHGESYLFRFLKFWLVEIILFLGFSSCAYISLQHRVSEKLKILFEYEEWREKVFPHLEIKQENKHLGKFDNYLVFETISLFSIAIFITLLSLTYISSLSSFTLKNVLTVAFIHFWGIIFIGRHYYSFRKDFFNGLDQIFKHFQNYGKEKLKKIPYHSDSKLAKFEQAYNHLLLQLEERDRSIRRYMDYETDQAQVRMLGESAGLIAHDLSGPLHTMLFCLEEIKDHRKSNNQLNGGEELQEEEVNPYYDYLEASLKRVHELVESFKAQIRNPDQNTSTCSFGEAYQYTLTVIKTQFRPQGIMGKINFSFDTELNKFEVSLSRLNLVHILYNFMKNSVENLLKNNISSAIISLKYEGYNKNLNLHKISISDNGTGLSSKIFTELTNENQLLGEQLGERRGLGLRLSRRLIERFGGKIEIDSEYEGSMRGTKFNFYFRGVLDDINEQKSSHF